MIAIVAIVCFVALAMVVVNTIATLESDRLPPERPAWRWTQTTEPAEASLICDGVDIHTAATLLDMVRRDHASERVVRLRYCGSTYEITKRRRGATVRALRGKEAADAGKQIG